MGRPVGMGGVAEGQVALHRAAQVSVPLGPGPQATEKSSTSSGFLLGDEWDRRNPRAQLNPRHKDTELPAAGSLPRCLQQAGLGQAEAGS